jgi:ketosteroid isomerase-like protein
MTEHPNAVHIRERFGTGDLAEMAEWLADDVVWHQIGGDTLRGKQSVIDSMSGFADVEFSMDLHDVVANDDHTIALMEVSIGTGGQSFSYRTAEIYHIDEDGKITERWAFSDDTQAINEFFSQFA